MSNPASWRTKMDQINHSHSLVRHGDYINVAADRRTLARQTYFNTNPVIKAKLARIQHWYEQNYPEFMAQHFMILVGDKETLVEDMQCNEHDQAVVKKMMQGGTPIFLHLNKKWKAPKNYDWAAHGGRPANQKYLEAPARIQKIIDEVNLETEKISAHSDEEQNAFNYVDAENGIYNGKCSDLGKHHLGFFKNTQVVTEMNNAGYGTTLWYDIPVYNSNYNWYGSNVIIGDCGTIFITNRTYKLWYLQQTSEINGQTSYFWKLKYKCGNGSWTKTITHLTAAQAASKYEYTGIF